MAGSCRLLGIIDDRIIIDEINFYGYIVVTKEREFHMLQNMLIVAIFIIAVIYIVFKIRSHVAAKAACDCSSCDVQGCDMRDR